MSRQKNISIGDIVRIRTWEEIAEEFPDGINDGFIDLPNEICITGSMCEGYAGELYQVTGKFGGDAFLDLDALDGSGSPGAWTWSVDMVEIIDESAPDPCVQPEQLFAILNGR